MLVYHQSLYPHNLFFQILTYLTSSIILLCAVKFVAINDFLSFIPSPFVSCKQVSLTQLLFIVSITLKLLPVNVSIFQVASRILCFFWTNFFTHFHLEWCRNRSYFSLQPGATPVSHIAGNALERNHYLLFIASGLLCNASLNSEGCLTA